MIRVGSESFRRPAAMMSRCGIIGVTRFGTPRIAVRQQDGRPAVVLIAKVEFVKGRRHPEPWPVDDARRPEHGAQPVIVTAPHHT